jgi:hypothetical protein
MNEDDILTKDVVVCVDMLTAGELDILLHADIHSSSDDDSLLSSDETEQPSLTRDQRRMHLLNNPDYGIVLDFLERFISKMNIDVYSLQRFEENLISKRNQGKTNK